MDVLDKIDNILRESKVAPNKVRKEVDKIKGNLIKKWEKKGGFENFGQKEVRALKDKYVDSSDFGTEMTRINTIIDEFDDWAMNYTG